MHLLKEINKVSPLNLKDTKFYRKLFDNNNSSIHCSKGRCAKDTIIEILPIDMKEDTANMFTNH